MSNIECVLVCFRWQHDGASEDEAAAYGATLLEELRGLGGRLVAWGGDRSSYRFERAAVHEVVERVIAVVEHAGHFAVGVAQRPLHFRGPAGQELAFGPALAVAEALATTAKFGEVLIDPNLDPMRAGELATVGSIPVVVGRERISGALLLPGICPPDGLRPSSPPSADASGGASSAAASQGAKSTRSGRNSSVPPPGGGPAYGLRGRAPSKPPSLRPSAPPPSQAELAEVERGLLAGLGLSAHELPPYPDSYPAAPPSPGLRPDPVTREPASAGGSSSPPPKPVGAESGGPGRRASVIEELQTGQVAGLCELMNTVQSDSRKRGASERLGALLAIAQGDRVDGLERLAAAARLATNRGGGNECRAVLAHAMGLAVDGQTERALLEGLSALARAREAEDARGQRASASFLAQLAETEHQYDASAAWQMLAMRYPLS